MQRRLFHERSAGIVPDTLIILQHHPAYTLGRRSLPFQPAPDDEVCNGIPVYRVDRGGGATYHGPGQVVAYPVLGLRSYTPDYYSYLRMLEEVIILTLSDFSIVSERLSGFTGVWAGGRKIASIGVRIVRGITMHGFSLNVNNDLTPFRNIIPCNIHAVQMTSMTEISGLELIMPEVEKCLVNNFARVFGVEMSAFMMYNIPSEYHKGGIFNAFSVSGKRAW